MLTTHPKEKRRTSAAAASRAATSPWKKAVVTLAEGQKIEFFEGV